MDFKGPGTTFMQLSIHVLNWQGLTVTLRRLLRERESRLLLLQSPVVYTTKLLKLVADVGNAPNEWITTGGYEPPDFDF